jgi:sugar transferase (PEP-CTERM/EpsH1 system associated)
MADRGELLVVVHRVPYPPDKGDKIRSYNQIKFLVEQGWKVHLCTLADDPSDMQHAVELLKLCASVAIEPLHPKLQKIKSLSAIFMGLPMSARYFYSKNLQQRVNDVLGNHPISAVLCYCSPMAEYLRRASVNPLPYGRNRHVSYIMDLVDVDSDKWEQYAKRHSAPMKWVYNLESRLLHRYERSITGWFDAVVLVSEAEANVFRHRVGCQHKIRAVGNGVDLAYFHPADKKTVRANSRISFCGAMNYLPNVDAVCWFAREVLPRIREKLGEVEFWIIGGAAGDEVRALGNLPGVRVTGRVDDVRPFVWDSDLAVAPIRIARGIQNKVLEAMAMGVSTLVSPQAFEGLEAETGRELTVSPAEPDEFAAVAIELLRDPQRRHDIARNARLMVEEKYSWEGRLQVLDDLLLGSFRDISEVQTAAQLRGQISV